MYNFPDFSLIDRYVRDVLHSSIHYSHVTTLTIRALIHIGLPKTDENYETGKWELFLFTEYEKNL